ncbi:hypothetical protein FRC06_010432 [Ceratobasidium sp. 370]|nr:hypothetical protein FRC06_010432 [Ceratobasidium sp. 370]
MSVMVNTEDMCPHSAVCQTSPNSSSSSPNANSDLDSDGKTNINSAWAGIAVVIVVFVVALGVWYAIRRRRRARGGHNSVDAGGGNKPFQRAFGAFWRRSSAAKSSEQPIAVGGDMELVEDEEAKRRRPSSSATNLKRTATSGTLETNESHATTLDAPLKRTDEESRLYPMAEAERSVEIPIPAPPEPPRDDSRTARPSTPSSIRSSLSRLSIPPPGLGLPIHAHAQSPVSVPPPEHPSS